MMRGRKVSFCEPSPRVVKVVLLGQEGVGKSAFAVRLLTRRFIGEYGRHLESTYRHFVEVENKPMCIDLRDTAGASTNKKLQQHILQADIFIIVYSITDKSSFVEATRIGHTIAGYSPDDAHSLIALVGTKKDLQHFREVDEAESAALAKELSCSSCEISVSDSEGYENVCGAMRAILREYARGTRAMTAKRTQHRRTSSGWYLAKMKEGIIKRTGSIRRKSVVF